MSSIWVELMGSEVRYLGRDYRTRVLEAGDGPPLLLLHGIGGHAEAWARNVVRLGRSHRAMAIDLLWHGFSARPEYVDGKDISTYGRQILDLLDNEDIETIDIEGESLSGWVGMWLALNHRDRIGRLILNTTAGIRWQPGSVPERDVFPERLDPRLAGHVQRPVRGSDRRDDLHPRRCYPRATPAGCHPFGASHRG